MSRSMRRSARVLLPLLAALAVLAVGSAQAAGPNSGANSALIQPDGKILAAGWGETASWGAAGVFGLARYTLAGSLDKSFGSGGKVAAPAGSWPGGRAVALQPDGKIVVAGTGDGGFGLVRYTPAGSLDRIFGAGGKVRTEFGSMIAQAAAVAVQADGKIVAAGPLWKGSQNGDQAGFGLARYNANGSLDTTFGTDGRVTTTVDGGGSALALAIQPDGKIVAAGSVGDPNVVTGDEFAVARYNPDGSLDTGFGSGGLFTSRFGVLGAAARAVALQPDGKIVVVGTAVASSSAPPEVVLARYNPDGTLDPSFDSDGVATTPFSTSGRCDLCGVYANAVAIQPDGKIVAAGEACLGGCSFALERYNPDGLPDTGFGSDGRVTTSFGSIDSCSGGGGDYANAVALQANGKILAAGYSNFGSCSPDYYKVALARYNAGGDLDTSFGKRGKVNTSVAACVVPRLQGETLSWAEKAVKRDHCAVGKISSVSSRTVKRGRIVSQHPAACVLRGPVTKVSLTVSKGGRRVKTSRRPSHLGAIVYDSFVHLGCGGGGGRPSHLFAIKPNGAAREQLTRQPGRNEIEPAWSPDGRTIAFSRGGTGGGVLLMNANGSHVRVVVRSEAANPTFSPNGKRIAYAHRSEIWSVRTDGKGKRKVLGNGNSPDWSPDGKQIAFVGSNENGLDIYVASRTETERKQLTHVGTAALPVWSPDGVQIAFISCGETACHLAIVDVSDGSSRVVAADVNDNTKPAWSPDGSRIAYDRHYSTGEQLVTVNTTGGGLRVITTMIGEPTGISWRR